MPVPLLLKGLYQREIVTEVGVHCYIYFQDNDAFFTLYNDQEFVYTKSLKYSIKLMHERFCELYGEQIAYTLFIELLSGEGLGSANREYQRDLIKLFGELFLHINDVLTYSKRAFELEKIDQDLKKDKPELTWEEKEKIEQAPTTTRLTPFSLIFNCLFFIIRHFYTQTQ